ncbi:MAG: hypothetical protein A3A58_02500 [Candidatus Blackburnbacteria bacterium RIFCSPLOWO2_01_FULL_41_27]|uniref:Nudix hydrolase domain-containing protein n=2 Tax=Candidatus Blackburniibacteriota TaxID=1817898 RepID=A0A1G1V446_9BACT|nr:MAG: hypothetical protein A3F61_02200 [Candidatus Blackburnbacteria bacterium RIFCSPHIGHO2_12_FULL_41_13b]OGY14768.1 MAG: hypothetical protein A3A58_02500 [Candidatus Blackburnbacteria bacterium RIFCSPLOWO2_01_FULL_41_27]
MIQERIFKPTEEEITENVIGVGVLLVTPDFRFLTVQELKTKRSTGKIVGMRTAPMETVIDGESDDDAIKRLFQEEVVLNEAELPLDKKVLLCKIQLTKGVWLHGYLLQIEQPVLAAIGTEKHEVSDPFWTSIEEVLQSNPDDRQFRPGVRELVLSYLTFLESPENFSPHLFFRTQGKVQDEVFDSLGA